MGRREGIYESIASDVTTIFKGKTAAQLEQLQTRIEDKLSRKAEDHMARARLRDRHQENLKKKLNILIQEHKYYNIIYDADLKYWFALWFKKHLSSSRNLVDISAVLLYIFTQEPIKRLCQMDIQILKKLKMMSYYENFNE